MTTEKITPAHDNGKVIMRWCHAPKCTDIISRGEAGLLLYVARPATVRKYQLRCCSDAVMREIVRYRRQEAALPPEIIQHDVGARSVKKTACANSNCSERIILSQSCVIFWIPHGDNWNEARDIVRHQWHLRCFGEAAMDFIRSHRMRLYGLLPQAHRTRVITLPT